MFLLVLGCNENTTKEIFEALTAKDIADVLESQCIKDASSIVERALIFKMCKNLSTYWGGEFAESFERVGSRGEALAPQPQPQLLYLQQSPMQKNKRDKDSKKDKRKELKHE